MRELLLSPYASYVYQFSELSKRLYFQLYKSKFNAIYCYVLRTLCIRENVFLSYFDPFHVCYGGYAWSSTKVTVFVMSNKHRF